MVSSIHSIRLWSSQAALNAFKDASDTSTSSRLPIGGSASSSLADILYPDNSDDGSDYEDTQLEALIASLQQAMNGGKTDDTQEDGDVGDMSSKAFMKALRDKLEGLQGSPDTKAMADKMLAALDAGTLTVTDAVNGEQVKAWDVTDSKQLSGAKTEVDKNDWTSYLKDILTRDGSGKFVRANDSSYIEKAGGASGFFGMVGEAYYYLSWTTPAPASGTSGGSTSGNGTGSSNGSSTK
ncbi:hypothetical protein KX729_03955 [Rhizobium sp. XQZ8]|uniref:hypothetical protein n=1 Tax=Rhizobium populisoli TaxID=2859785 RepID=UPI001CA59AA8|nr:hypothetical protein [Rhizobium populisoli]MBW6420585.1 hypothetical protein [Rhizobium populisoli]